MLLKLLHANGHTDTTGLVPIWSDWGWGYHFVRVKSRYFALGNPLKTILQYL